MMKKEFICIRCPMGCPLTVTMEGDEVTVTGNTCPRGEEYGKKELLNPTRVITSSVNVINGVIPMVSVKTKQDIPKGRIFDVMKEIRQTTVNAPVRIGDVILANCAGTGVDIVATKNVDVIK